METIQKKKINIRGLQKDELAAKLEELGEKKFRASQIHQWLWQKSAKSFDEMSNLPKSLREFLHENFIIHTLTPKTTQKSSDGTIKSAIELYDQKVVESVLIPSGKRMTACISSQVGCSLDCNFCATAKLKMMRNLTADEIYDQVVEVNNQAKINYGNHLTNIVYMGMGEPLLNYSQVMRSAEMITSPEGLGMSPKRITLSTSGIAKMIKKLGDDKVKFNFALSLHSANNEKRSKIMSINNTNPLEDLADALKYFYQKTGTRVTYEYLVFKDFNDEIEDAKELVAFTKHIPSKVNIIEYNPIDEVGFQQASPARLRDFVNYLEKHNVIVNIRRSRGKDIDAACGQLANKH